MSLAERCAHEVLEDERRRAQSYFDEGRVSVGRANDKGVEATVLAPQGPSAVKLDWSRAGSGQLVAECTCSRFAEFVLCEHVWAALLACDGKGYHEKIAGDGPLEVEFELPRRDDGAFRFDEAATPERLMPGMAPRRSEERPQPYRPEAQYRNEPPYHREPPFRNEPDATAGWRQQFRFLRTALEESAVRPSSMGGRRRREVWYRIDASECMESGVVVVALTYRQQQKDGDWGPLQPLHLSPREIRKLTTPEDRDLASFFLATQQPRSGHLESRGLVPSVLYGELLPRLAATGRFGWVPGPATDPAAAAPLAWDAGAPWRFVLRLERRDERTVRLAGELERAGERRTLAEPVAILGNGLVILPDRVARLDGEQDFPWIWTLRRRQEILVPEAQIGTMLEELWNLPVRPRLEAPSEWDLEEVRLAPRPEVAFQPLKRDPRVIEATLSFDYDGCSVASRRESVGVVDRPRRRVLLRDAQAEQAAAQRLLEIGLRRPPRYQGRHEFQLSPKAMPAAVALLVDEGWSVTAEGRRLRRFDRMNMALNAGIDWFELHADADFDGVRMALPELLKAVRRGERFVRLGDGSQGMLPEEWIRRYLPLAQLAQEDEDGVIRFQPSQTMLLDALLAAEPDVDVDSQFERLRDRLSAFQKIEPATAPRGFRGTLRTYQQEGLGWIRFLQEFGFGGCLADDMGLGKTIQVLALLQSRRLGRGWREPSLIVVPRSVMYNWLDEAERFTPRLLISSFHGPDRPEFAEVYDQHDVVVTTYGTLRRDVVEIKDYQFDYVILDEAQAIKNASSQSAKACRLLTAAHRLALTGTPVENHLGELGSIFEFLNPGMLGRLSAFDGAAGARQADDGVLEGLARALKPFILRRTKEQVLSELPEKTEQTLFCELDDGERRLYEELRDHYRAALKERIEEVGLGRAKIQVLEALLRLRQAACHPGLLDAGRAGEGSAKLETLLEQLDEVLDEGHKALVFSQFTTLLAIVRGHLDRKQIVYEYLDGRTRNRREKVERFQNDADCKLFLISLKAGGVGLNLTAADYVFILDPWWNPAVEAQAVDRAHRIGQTRPVFAYRLIARGTVEEKILELQEGKRELAEAILTADQSLIKNLSADDLRFLLS